MVCLIEFYYGVVDDGYVFGGAGAVEDEVGGVVVHYISHGVVGGEEAVDEGCIYGIGRADPVYVVLPDVFGGLDVVVGDDGFVEAVGSELVEAGEYEDGGQCQLVEHAQLWGTQYAPQEHSEEQAAEGYAEGEVAVAEEEAVVGCDGQRREKQATDDAQCEKDGEFPLFLFMRCEHLGAGQEDEYGEYERDCPNCQGVFEDGEYEVEVDGYAFEEELKGLGS